jgi:hypothetical protein
MRISLGTPRRPSCLGIDKVTGIGIHYISLPTPQECEAFLTTFCALYAQDGMQYY